MTAVTNPELEVAWGKTCKLLLGGEIGRLDEFADYLQLYLDPVNKKKSAISGKSVALSSNYYRDNSNFISQDEVDFNKKFEPLDINEIKDIDSISQAVAEQVQYTGNKVFGNSQSIHESDNCTDSFYISNSHNIEGSRFVAYSMYIRDNSEYIFGSYWLFKSNYILKSSAVESSRCFEAHICNGSDLFFCYNCWGCSHLMFSFNQRAKRYLIGNLELPKDKYFELRKKLVDESREYLKKHKRFYLMFDRPPVSPKLKSKISSTTIKLKQEKGNMAPIETAFKSTCRVIFGKEIGSLRQYENYLTERLNKITTSKTVFGNEVPSATIFFYKFIPQDRRISNSELGAASRLRIELGDGDGLDEIMKKLDDISLYQMDFCEGANANIIDTPIAYHAVNVYSFADATYTKDSAYCTLAPNCEAIFGSFRPIYSKFCIRCNNSVNLTACFEMDCCTNCANSMFCHNCENLDHCMFCFNIKSKRYAIGNVEVGREKYLEIRKQVLDEIVTRLEKDKKLGLSIYSVGCKG